MLAYRYTQYENRCDELEAVVLSQMISLIVVGLGGMSPMAGYLIKMVTQQVGMRKGRHLMPFFPLFNIVNISDRSCGAWSPKLEDHEWGSSDFHPRC